jgi:hypothetical protein
MRLLQLEDNGEFSLTEYIGKDVPPYAILSHTWGADDEEVTFRDLRDGTGKNKLNYIKLTFCAKRAAHDGLQYFWVDTCCIDKSSSAELSEAINSMFQWYYMADRCYVYLSDVAVGSCVGKNPPPQQTWKLAFRRSRWFTRGWTLQELLAPTLVEFFSAEGERLGEKKSMAREIQEITGICTQALLGSPLSEFSVDERMSWAKRRETKREEDAAYALLGIFDIHMPLLYGERREKAFTRLGKEIRESLKDETHAPSPALSSQPPKRRRGEDRETQSIRRNVVCFKCRYFQYLTKVGDNRADCQFIGGELGHYANDPHCFECNFLEASVRLTLADCRRRQIWASCH